MNTRYQKKLIEIGKARNGSKTAAKVRGIKWTNGQKTRIRLMAGAEQAPSIEMIKSFYPHMGDYKSDCMLTKVKLLRKEMSELTGVEDGITGIRKSKGKGIVYLVENEMYPGWIKCGMTIDMNNRLNSYNCNDPLKRFRVIVAKEVENRRKSETSLIRELRIISSLSNGEWFRVDKETAMKIFNTVK